jgi:hypothetical protein
MRQDSLFFFRAAVGGSAILIGFLGLWVMTAELIRPRSAYFPSDQSEAQTRYVFRHAADTAAVVGGLRGDLWADAAIANAAPLLFEPPGNSPQGISQADVEHARALAERAARLTPLDSRVWLVLANLDFRAGGSSRKTVEALKLSYYTGPNVLSLMPLRLLLTVQSDAILDEELQGLVPLEVQRIVMQRPDLKPAIALAYKKSLPKGREIIEAALKNVDPEFLSTIAASSRTR